MVCPQRIHQDEEDVEVVAFVEGHDVLERAHGAGILLGSVHHDRDDEDPDPDRGDCQTRHASAHFVSIALDRRRSLPAVPVPDGIEFPGSPL